MSGLVKNMLPRFSYSLVISTLGKVLAKISLNNGSYIDKTRFSCELLLDRPFALSVQVLAEALGDPGRCFATPPVSVSGLAPDAFSELKRLCLDSLEVCSSQARPYLGLEQAVLRELQVAMGCVGSARSLGLK